MVFLKTANFGLFILGRVECDLHQNLIISSVICKACLLFGTVYLLALLPLLTIVHVHLKSNLKLTY